MEYLTQLLDDIEFTHFYQFANYYLHNFKPEPHIESHVKLCNTLTCKETISNTGCTNIKIT